MKTAKIKPLKGSTENGTIEVMLLWESGEMMKAADLYKIMHNVNTGERIDNLTALGIVESYYKTNFSKKTQ